MSIFSISVETTANATAGATAANTALQVLAAAGKDLRLVAVGIFQKTSAAGENSGRWVIDRISAVGTGSALVPKKMDPRGPASAITDTSKTVSNDLTATNTLVSANDAIVELGDGWNFFDKVPIWAGVAQGFALRRATAPTGARVVVVVMIYEEA